MTPGERFFVDRDVASLYPFASHNRFGTLTLCASLPYTKWRQPMVWMDHAGLRFPSILPIAFR